MRPRLLLIPLLVAPIFFSASGTAALEPAEPQGAAAPNAAAWSALQSRLRVGPTYVELEDGTLTRVEHQMMAVLAALDMARARPDDGPALRAHARDLWNRSMQAFDAQYGFFAVSLPPPDQQVCIEAETNGWALLATASLRSEAPSDAALDTIGNELRAMLQDLLAAGSHRGKGPCLADEGAVPFDQRPVALLGLMAWRDAAADASLDPVVRNELKTVMGRNLRDKAFLSKDEKDGTYRTAPNAQLLIAITDQVRAENDSALRATRDDLAEFLMTVLIQDQGEIAVPVDLQVGSPSPNAIPGSGIEMLWSAAAVEAYGREQPDKVVPGLAGRLLEAFYRTYWDAARGGFVSAARLVTFEDNCLAVVLTTGPRLFSVTRNPGHVALVVRTHGGPGVITNNLLTVRFALASGPDLADKTVLIAPRELAPFEVDSSQALRLSRIIGGQPRPELEAPVLVPGRTPLLRFTSQLGPTPAFFTLDGPSPTVLQGSDVQKAIVVTLANRATVPIELASLQLDLEVTNVTVQTLLLNGNPLIPADVRDRVVTESLRVPHLRVVVANVNLPPGDSTLQISFSDVEPPLIGAVFFAQDANGTDVLPSKPPVRLTEGARPYVLAVVGDNAMVRQVLLLFRVGTQAVELPMEPVAGSDGLFSGQLPLLATGGPAQATVRAVDTWDNLEEKTVAVEIENPLLVGNQVLFVFSGILFLSSVVIWLKVRRKGVA